MQGDLLDNDLRIDEISARSLSETAKWAKLLSVVGFVLTGLIVLVAIFAGSILATLSRTTDNPEITLISTGVLSVTYLIIGAVYFFMSLYLFRFATNMKTALSTVSQENLNASFHNLKNVYKIMGIITIIYLGIMALALLIAITTFIFASR